MYSYTYIPRSLAALPAAKHMSFSCPEAAACLTSDITARGGGVGSNGTSVQPTHDTREEAETRKVKMET